MGYFVTRRTQVAASGRRAATALWNFRKSGKEAREIRDLQGGWRGAGPREAPRCTNRPSAVSAKASLFFFFSSSYFMTREICKKYAKRGRKYETIGGRSRDRGDMGHFLVRGENMRIGESEKARQEAPRTWNTLPPSSNSSFSPLGLKVSLLLKDETRRGATPSLPRMTVILYVWLEGEATSGGNCPPN